jgi:uncharacterized protein
MADDSDVEFNADKSERNFRERGIDFAFAAKIFHGPHLEMEDRRYNYGEPRLRVYALIANVLYVVVYTWRDGRRRIISARRGNRRERRLYDRLTAAQGPD